MSSPHPQSEEIFRRLLDESAARLAAPEDAGIAIPDDDLHREIIVPLLPAMLGDKSIRQHWSEQAATGFPARLARHFENGEPAPRWRPGDFEIHVTASYNAGADARALADTLLSEDSLRDMTAALMNQLLDVLWPPLAPAQVAAPAEPEPAVEISSVEIPGAEVPVPTEFEIPAPEIAAPAEAPPATEIPEAISAEAPEPEITPVQPLEIAEEIPRSAEAHERAWEIHPRQLSSRALIRALCRAIPAAAMQRSLIAIGAYEANAAILSRRILVRATRRTPCGPTSRRRYFGKCRAC